MSVPTYVIYAYITSLRIHGFMNILPSLSENLGNLGDFNIMLM